MNSWCGFDLPTEICYECCIKFDIFKRTTTTKLLHEKWNDLFCFSSLNQLKLKLVRLRQKLESKYKFMYGFLAQIVRVRF